MSNFNSCDRCGNTTGLTYHRVGGDKEMDMFLCRNCVVGAVVDREKLALEKFEALKKLYEGR